MLRDIGTHELLLHIIESGLRTLLNISGTTVEGYDIDQQNPLTTLMLSAGQEQDSLGWDNFLRGRHSKLFEEAYDEYLATKPRVKMKYKKGITWATRLVQDSLTLLCKVWTQRSKHFHQPEQNEEGYTTKLSDARVRSRVEEVYDNREYYHRLIQDNLFQLPREDRLKQSTFNLVKWLETVDRADNAGLVGQENIYQYFHPTRPPDIPEE